jgi:hypothetical protein
LDSCTDLKIILPVSYLLAFLCRFTPILFILFGYIPAHLPTNPPIYLSIHPDSVGSMLDRGTGIAVISCVQKGPLWDLPSFGSHEYLGGGSLHRRKDVQSVKLTTRIYLDPRLKMRGNYLNIPMRL